MISSLCLAESAASRRSISSFAQIARQIAGPGQHIGDLDFLGERLARQRPIEHDLARHNPLIGRHTHDGADFLPLRDHRRLAQELRFAGGRIHDFHIEQPGRVERGEQLEGPPGDDFIGIDLREQAIGALGGGLHERPVPALADADADVRHALRQHLGELARVALPHRRDAGPDVHDVRILGVLRELEGRLQALLQIESADQVSALEKLDRGGDVSRASRTP